MKISLEHLNEFVDITDLTAEEIAAALTMSGLEVEDIEKTGAAFTNIITAKIEEISAHPNADKLHLVKVNLGGAYKTVVCGAQNIKEGQIIPYASIGSKVLNRKTGEPYELTPAVIRGIESQGMLCSQEELGLSNLQEEDGILILNRLFDNIELGSDLEKLLNIKEDTILDTAPTANRGDEMSVIGIAREICALFNKKLNFEKVQGYDNKTAAGFNIEIKAQDACRYYSAAVLKNLKIKPSPDWMQRRLEASGIRAINNIVDITNYVMLEYGQPLHAFDADKLGNYICVRRAEEGETAVTLDGIERKLTNDTILCADRTKGVCIAGVFGCLNSGIDENTKNMVLEAAYFTPALNRKSARSAGYRSEASARFERGIDIETVKPALMRACDLLVKYADAEFEGIKEAGSNEPEKIEITLRFSRIKKILGMEIPSEKCVEILQNLGFELLGRNDAAVKFKVPGFRTGDVKQEIDLIEETARIYGYDKIEPSLPSKTKSPEILKEEKLLNAVRKMFSGFGFNECITSSLIGEPLLNRFGISYNKDEAVFVQNPQSDEHTMLRQTLAANILDTLNNNINNGQKNVWLFETGKTYFVKKPADKINSGAEENQMLAGVMTGETNNNLWKKLPEADFYSLKGYLESLFDLMHLSNRIKFNPAEDIPVLHPGRSAKIVLLGSPISEIGYFGELHPVLSDKLKTSRKVYLFEINLGKLIQAAPDYTVKYKPLPSALPVQRDISFAIEKNISNEQIVLAVKKSADSKIFKGINLFDIYEGEHIQEGFKSLAYRITLQNEEAALTDEIIDSEIAKIKSGLMKKFPAVSFR